LAQAFLRDLRGFSSRTSRLKAFDFSFEFAVTLKMLPVFANSQQVPLLHNRGMMAFDEFPAAISQEKPPAFSIESAKSTFNFLAEKRG
jgi:hypothetical protein